MVFLDCVAFSRVSRILSEGLAFRRSVPEGLAQNITVSHPLVGVEPRAALTASPDTQAREIGPEMLQTRTARLRDEPVKY